MSKKTIVALVLVAGISALGFSSVAEAYNGMGGQGYHNGMGGQGYHNGMGMGYNQPGGQAPFTAEQEAAYTKLYNEHVKSIAPLQKEFVMKQAEYEALMRQPNPDPAQASKLAGELADFRIKFQTAADAYSAKLEKEVGVDASYGGMMGGRGMMNGRGMMDGRGGYHGSHGGRGGCY